MEFGWTKLTRVVLALLLAVAWAVPACAGGERCSMPCCKAKTKPAPAHQAMPCCAQPQTTGCDVDSGCAFAKLQTLQSALPEARPADAEVALASVPSTPVVPANLPAVPPARSGPPLDTPLYLITLSLLI
ncbi:MAG: hypothetical protein MUE48_03130 [Desulfobacterales bacterium]|jgi:hypothetical protein|nr:hypothetical protein [Desulfobacterales bacterium]